VPSRTPSANTPPESTEYEDYVYARTADPNAVAGARNPSC
jgi:hypothetical protein